MMLKKIYSLLAALAFIPVVYAADNVWVGDDNQSNGAWSRTGNWTNNTAPNFQTNNRIVFQNNLKSTNMLYDIGGWIQSSDIIWASTFNVSRTLMSTGSGIDFATRVENLSSYTQTVAMNLSGGKFGAGDIQLNPVNGDLVINGTIYNDNSLSYNIWGNTGRTLTLNGTLGPNATQSGVAFTVQRNTTVEVNTNQLWQGTTTMNGGTLRVGASGLLGDGNYSGAVALNSLNGTNASLVFSNSRSQTMSGGISGSGGVTMSGTGTTTLSGSNSYTGNTLITSGTIQVGNGGTTGSLGSGAVVVNGTLAFNRSDAVTVSGAISGAGSLTHYGTGTTTLAAANTYTGLTKVTAGTIVLGAAGSVATNSSAQVDNGASLNLAAKNQALKDVKANGTISGSGTMTVTGTLSGSGTINPDTVVVGTHSPGNSPGIQTFGGNLAYQPDSTMVWQLIANTTSNSPVVYDQVIVGGNLTFNGATSLQLVFNDVGSLVNWTDALWSSNQSWTIYQVSGLTSGLENLTLASYSGLLDAYGNDFGTTLAGSSFSISQDGQNVTLIYTVPEPSTYALLGLGVVALLFATHRRNRTS